MITDWEANSTAVVLPMVSVILAKNIWETFQSVIMLNSLQEAIPLTFVSVGNVCVDDGIWRRSRGKALELTKIAESATGKSSLRSVYWLSYD